MLGWRERPDHVMHRIRQEEGPVLVKGLNCETPGDVVRAEEAFGHVVLVRGKEI